MDLTKREEWTVWFVISELDPRIELVVMEDPVRVVKYPIVVERVGTYSDDFTSNDD